MGRVYIIYQKYNIETKMREHIYTIEHMDISVKNLKYQQFTSQKISVVVLMI